jgi:hypothetical protein
VAGGELDHFLVALDRVVERGNLGKDRGEAAAIGQMRLVIVLLADERDQGAQGVNVFAVEFEGLFKIFSRAGFLAGGEKVLRQNEILFEGIGPIAKSEQRLRHAFADRMAFRGEGQAAAQAFHGLFRAVGFLMQIASRRSA